LDEAQATAIKRVKERIKLESEMKRDDEDSKGSIPEERRENLDLGEIRKEAHRIFLREQEEIKEA
jgi:hypothetical protein